MARRTPVTVEQPFSRMHSRSRLHHLPAINQSTNPINQSTNQAINQSTESTNHSQHTTYTLSILSCLVVLTFVTLLFNPSSGFPKKKHTPPVWPPGSFGSPLLGAPHPGWSSGRPETQCSPPSNTDYLVTRAKDRIIYGTATRRVWMSCWTWKWSDQWWSDRWVSCFTYLSKEV